MASESTSTPTLTKSLRAFGEMPAEGGDADPLIEVMNSLAHQAADRIEALEADLKMLICLDVTAREGQSAFAEWRNKYERKSR
jgi:hypothetical protein